MDVLLAPLTLVSGVAILAVLLGRHVDRARAACGVLLLALAAAATVIAPGDGPLTTLASRAASAGIPRATLLIDAGLALAGLTVLLGTGLLAVRVRTPDAGAASDRMAPVPRRALAAGLLVLAAPTLWTLALAATIAAWLISPGGRGRAVLAACAGLPLAAVAWFAGQVGDTRDVWLLRLADVPLSDAAQRAAVVPMLCAAGVWLVGVRSVQPLRRSTAWVGVALLARVGAALVPLGLEALSPVLFPLAIGAVAWAAWRRDAAAAALLALALGAVAVRSPVLALGLSLAAMALAAVSVSDRRDAWRQAAWIAAAIAAVQVLPTVLRTQVSWTLLLLAVLAAAALRSGSAPQAVD